MSKILCIDFGTKRIGLSIPIRSIAFGLETVDYNHLIATIDKYIKNKYIDTIVIGHPLKSEQSLFPIEKDILKFRNFLKKKYPKLIIKRIDERFSSKIANYFLINSFFNKKKINKKKINKKKILDKISAILLLQDFINNSSSQI